MVTPNPGTPHRVHAANFLPRGFPDGALVATLYGNFVGLVGATRIQNGRQLVQVRNAADELREFADFELALATPEQQAAYDAKVKARR